VRALAISCLIGALASDLAYWRTADFVWADFSDWLITGAVVVGALAFLVAIVEALARRRRGRVSWGTVLLNLVAWGVAAADMLVHTRDSWTSIAPWGVGLSALAVLIACVAVLIEHSATRPILAEELA